MKLDVILGKLSGVRKSGDSWMAKCPSHADHEPSLSIARKNGRVLLKCFAGCEPEAVVQALGLSMSDLFDKPNEQQEARPVKGRIVKTYDYLDASGNLLFQVVRYEPKSFRQRRPDGKGGWIWNLQGVQRVLYRLPEVVKTVEQGDLVFISEGEKDCLALAKIGLTATTNPGGAGKWEESYSRALEGASVCILPDNDDPGRKHGQDVARSLYGKAESIKMLELPNLPPKGDISDWLEAGHTREGLLQLVERAVEYELSEFPEESSVEDLQQRTDTKIAILTKFYPRPFTDHILHRVPFRWEGERGLLWRFDSSEGLWRPDGESFISAYFRRDIETISDDLKKRNVIQEIVADVAGCSYSPGGLPEPSLHLIPFANGVYDLNAGGFREFQADDHFTFKLPHRYNPAAKASLLPEIIGNLLPEGDTVTLYELIAYCLWRDYSYQRVFFLLGGGGNGKSLFTQTILSHFLGTENVTQIGLQSLQEERFAAAQLHRRLANVAGESPYCDLKSTETLKALCGWDVLTADRKYLTPVKFKNHAKLCFVCNQLPKTHDTTDAFYRRAFIIEFPKQFPDDPTLPMRITENPEEFEWLAVQAVRTLQDLRARNFIFTRHQGLDWVKGEYERRSNPLVRFITERCVRDGEGHIFKWEFGEQFQEFLSENGFIRWSDTRLGSEMKQLGYETGKRSGTGGKEWNAWLGMTWLNPQGSQDSQGFQQQFLGDIRAGYYNPGDPGDPGGSERGTDPDPTTEKPSRPIIQGVSQPGKCCFCGARSNGKVEGQYICLTCYERRYPP